MSALRMVRVGELLPNSDIAVLRGIEGARMKEIYKRLSAAYGIGWGGRRYDRNAPERDDLANAAINHASTAVYALAQVAVAVTGTLPQLGFIHEDSGRAFALDVADLFRDSVTLPVAFEAAKTRRPDDTLERAVRRHAGKVFTRDKIVERMIDRIKELFGDDDSGGHEERPRPLPGLPGLGDVRGDDRGVHVAAHDEGGAGPGVGRDDGVVRGDGEPRSGGGDDVA